MGKRNDTYDIMKGIGIIAVIIGHMTIVPYMPYRNFIFSFHMPLFFILGGYFYKPNYNFKDKIKKDNKRLVVPYLFTSSLLLFYNFLLVYVGNDPTIMSESVLKVIYGSGSGHASMIGGNIPAIGAIWFLLALFWCRVSYNFIYCKIGKDKYWWICLCVAFIATAIDRYLINLPFAILPGLSAMIFYLIGDYLKQYHISKSVLIICMICWIVSIMYSHIWMVQCHYGMYPIDILGACGGTVFIYWISKLIEKTKIKGLFIWLGVNSLVILCFHLIELNCSLCGHLHIPRVFCYQFPVKLLFCVLMTWLCYKFKFTRYIFSLSK